MRFSLAKFIVVSGLRCVGKLDKFCVINLKDNLSSMYFSSSNKIIKNSVEEVFLSKKVASDDDDKHIVQYFVKCFLFCSPK